MWLADVSGGGEATRPAAAAGGRCLLSGRLPGTAQSSWLHAGSPWSMVFYFLLKYGDLETLTHRASSTGLLTPEPRAWRCFSASGVGGRGGEQSLRGTKMQARSEGMTQALLSLGVFVFNPLLLFMNTDPSLETA